MDRHRAGPAPTPSCFLSLRRAEELRPVGGSLLSAVLIFSLVFIFHPPAGSVWGCGCALESLPGLVTGLRSRRGGQESQEDPARTQSPVPCGGLSSCCRYHCVSPPALPGLPSASLRGLPQLSPHTGLQSVGRASRAGSRGSPGAVFRLRQTHLPSCHTQGCSYPPGCRLADS